MWTTHYLRFSTFYGMPKRKRKFIKRPIKRGKRKRRRLRVRRRGTRRRLRFIPHALPPVYVCQLRYSDTVDVPVQRASGVAKIYFHKFRANNCYDPDWSGFGHTPMGFDEISQHYRKYIVLKAVMTATMISASTAVARVGYRGIRVAKYISDTDDTHITNGGTIDTDKLFEQKRKFRQSRTMRHVFNLNGNTPETHGATFMAKKWYKKGYVKEPDFWMGRTEKEATTSLNPDTTKNVYFYLWATPDDHLADISTTAQYRVNIVYTVRFFDREAFAKGSVFS